MTKSIVIARVEVDGKRPTKELLIERSNTIFAMPVDPVCGIEMDEKLATRLNHQGRNYYFCSEGCKKIFVKKPRKYRS